MKKRMELRNPSNGETLENQITISNVEHLQNPNPYPDEFGSNCSTPYVSAPSSPGRAGIGAYYFSAPASPMHYVLSSGELSAGRITSAASTELIHSSDGSFEFGGSNASGPMISADELFLNGQIRPMKLSSHLQRPHPLAPLLDLDEEEDGDGENGGRGRGIRLKSRSIHRRSRSMSPMRNTRSLPWEEEEEEKDGIVKEGNTDLDPKPDDPVTAPDSASSSRSSSSGRNSKRWIFLKDLLYRSKSDGGGSGRNGKEKEKEKEKFWSFSPAKDKPSKSPRIPPSSSEIEKDKTTKKNSNVNRLGKRQSPAPSAHERLYTANRAQAEEMRRRTFLPYRQGLFGCLGFSSKGYGAVNGFAKTLNPVSSR